MFGGFRGSSGYTLLAAGAACLLLAAYAIRLPLFRGAGLLLSAGLAAAGIALLAAWWRESRASRYDLKRLFDEPPPEPEEPREDALLPDETGAPYCAWCDECYAPGTPRCRHCGRSL